MEMEGEGGGRFQAVSGGCGWCEVAGERGEGRQEKQAKAEGDREDVAQGYEPVEFYGAGDCLAGGADSSVVGPAEGRGLTGQASQARGSNGSLDMMILGVASIQ